MMRWTSSVRELLSDEASAYVALHREMLLDAPHAFSAPPDNDRVSNEDLIGTHLMAQREKQPGAPVATAGAFTPSGALVSVCTIVREEGVKRAHIATICSVYTTPEQRGRGACGMMLRVALDLCAAWDGIEVVQLVVKEKSHSARRLYERVGLVAWGTEPDAIRVNGQSAAEVHMSCMIAHAA